MESLSPARPDLNRIETTMQRLDVSRQTVVRMLDEGVLRAVRPLGAGKGRLVLVTEESIQALLATAGKA